MSDDVLWRLAQTLAEAPDEKRPHMLAQVAQVVVTDSGTQVSVQIDDQTLPVVGWSGAFQAALVGNVVGSLVMVILIDGQPWISDISYGGI